MNTALYFLIGTIATILGALPLGTVNLSVINTSIKQNTPTAMKIAFAAGVAEVMLTFFALHYSMMATHFIMENNWLQFLIAIVLTGAGVFIFLRKKKDTAADSNYKNNSSKYATGLFLGLLNPPVIIYWLLAIGYINMNAIPLTMNSSIYVLLIFFGGVYFGKVFTLYLYSKAGGLIKNKIQNINRFIGIALILIGLIQALKLTLQS